MSTSTSRARRRVVLPSVVFALVSAAALGGCASPGTSAAGGEELTTVRVQLGWINTVSWGGFFQALDRGYYEEEGLNVELIPGGPNSPGAAAAVASGSADIGIISNMGTLLQAIADGDDFTVLGSHFQDLQTALISLSDNPIDSVGDINGKTILGTDGSQLRIDALLRLAGLEPDYAFQSVGSDIAALVEGVGDAYAGFATENPIVLEQEYGMTEDDYVVTRYTDMGLHMYTNLIFAEQDFIDADPDVVTGFLKASIRGWQAAEEDQAGTVDLVVDDFGVDLGLDYEQQARFLELLIPEMKGKDTDEHGLFWVDPDRIEEEMYPGMAAAGITGYPADASSYVDTTYLQEALSQLQ